MTLTIRNHRLVGPGVAFRPANAMGGEIAPSLAVLHDTAGRLDKGSSVNWFADRKCTVSAHVVVERDGSIVQMVPFNRKAFHAGESVWKGRRYCNGFALGVEIVSPGLLDQDGKAWFGQAVPPGTALEFRQTREHGPGWWLPYTPAQIDAVKRICRAMMAAYPDCNDIATHWMISPGRKIDCSPLLPLADITAYATGEAEPESADIATAAETGSKALPPSTVAASTEANAAVVNGSVGAGIGATTIAAAVGKAGSGGTLTAPGLAIALASDPLFWAAATVVLLSIYQWLRRAKLLRMFGV